MNPIRILIGTTGSEDCVQVLSLVRQLRRKAEEAGVCLEIKMVPTTKAAKYLDLKEVKSQDVQVFTEEDEWAWKSRGDPVVHIELKKWSDLMVIAPIDCETLGKIACGICDNLLTTVVRAWDIKAKKPLIFAPAMNSAMWANPFTSSQIEKLESFGFELVPPRVEGKAEEVALASMAAVESIVECVFRKLGDFTVANST